MATASRRRTTKPATRDPEATAAARDARLAELHTQLAAGVAAARSSAGWRAWLDVAARFPSYSMNNLLLIQAQRPGATMVCGYRAWQAMGRQVRRGEKGIFILAPILTRNPRHLADPSHPESERPDGGERIDITDTTTATDSGKRPQRLVGFRPVAVFDLASTDGDPIPTPPRPELLAGEAPVGLWESLVAVAADAGFPVACCPSAADIGGANGITDFTNQTITVRADVDDAQAAKTLIHEIGHALQHAPEAGQPWVCRGTAEVEAESVAYLVAAHHGLDTSAYTFDYIAGWAPDDQAVTATANRVLQAARTILATTDPTSQQVSADTATAVSAGCANTAAIVEAATQTLAAATTANHAAVTAQPAMAEAAGAGTVMVKDLVAAPVKVGGAADPTGIGVDRILEINTAAASWFANQAVASPAFTHAAAARGHDARTLIGLGVGWAPTDRSALTNHLMGVGFALPELVAAGVTRTDRYGRGYDLFRGRIMFPVTDAAGGVAGFTGRDTAGRPGAPKYLNTPANLAYRKSELLYGTAHITEATGTVVLVEGPWDALAVTLANRGSARPDSSDQWMAVGLAACGTAITPAHLALVAGLGCDIICCPDPDRAGLAALGRTTDQLAATGRHPQALRLPAGVDLAELHTQEGAVGVQETLSRAIPAGIVFAQTSLELNPPAGNPHERVTAARAAAAHTRGLTPDQLGALAATLMAGTGLTPEAVMGVIRPPAASIQTLRPPTRPARMAAVR